METTLRMHKIFLRWLLFVSLSTVGLVLAFQQGIVEEIWATDMYYISTTIFALFLYATVSCGYLALKLGESKTSLEKIAIQLERNWFIASILSSLGFFGTIVGMVIMTTGIGDMDLANVNLTDFGVGMSMALYTTGVGLICRIFLRTQCFTVQQALSDLQDKVIYEE